MNPYPQRRRHQIRALAALGTAYERAGRAQLHWACGTGKTLVGRWHAEDSNAETVLVLLPSLALVAQTLAEWQTASEWPFSAMVVCSDPSAGDAWRIDPGWWAERGVQVTTDAAAVTTYLTGRADLPRVVFSTYHSTPVVATAVRRARSKFDVMVCDEAHRLAGEPDERFRVCLDDGQLPAKRRLFTTATPIYAAGQSLSMSNTALFGPVVDKVDFGEAIEDGLLVDYQVMVLDASGDASKLGTGNAVPAAVAAASREGLTRLITFHSRVAYARQFAAAVDGLALPDGRTIRAASVAGTDPTANRRRALDNLADGDPAALTLVSNARCLTEGVNVPAVDGVVFADPKTSDTDIVQAIGRALRPAPGKTRGLIILPVVMSAGGTDNDELFAGPFAAVWGVLRALRNLDPRMAAEIDRARLPRTNAPDRPGRGWAPSLVTFDLDGIDLAAFAGRIVQDTGNDDLWDETADLLAKWAVEHGHTAVPVAATINGRFIGRWAHTQRRAYAAGALSPDRAARLARIPGWAWSYDGAWWSADHAAVTAAAGDHLDLEDPDISGRRLTHRAGKNALTVGRWCALQRRAWRDAELGHAPSQLCESIPGWSWRAGVPERDLKMVDALAEWVETHGDANAPHDAKWLSAPIGAFVTAVRRRAVMGTLSAALAADIAAVTPAKPAPGAFDWRPNETRWELHLLALSQYAARTGGCAIPEHGTEVFRGWTANLYAWATRQRHLYRHGELDGNKAELLEAIPGWQWERERTARVVVGIGARQHGTRLGYAAGCICDDCTAANTAYESERQRRRASGEATTDLVNAAAARGHLRLIEGQVGHRARPSMQQVTGLNKKTIDDVINGDRKRVTPEVDAALRAVTAEQLTAHIAAHPSGRDPMPAAPTLAQVDDLVRRGWPRAWISREIGGDGRALQIGKTGNMIRRETADAIAALHNAVGRRSAPHRERRQSLPTLAEIVTAEQDHALTTA